MLTALDVLGYERPTQLRGERARLVGLVLPELQNPIFPALADVIGDALAQHGLTPLLCTRTAGGVSEAEYVDLLLQHRVSGVVFAGGLYAHGRRAARPLPAAVGAAAAGGADQRRHRAPRLPAGVLRRRGRGGAGRRAPALARARADRDGAGHVGPRAVPAQAGVVPGGAGGAGRTSVRRRHRARAVLHRGRPGRRGQADRPRHHRHPLRQRPDGARLGPGRPPPGEVRAGRGLDRRLRRLAADDLRRAAADHDPAADRGDGPGRGGDAGGADRGGRGRGRRAAVRAGAGRARLHRARPAVAPLGTGAAGAWPGPGGARAQPVNQAAPSGGSGAGPPSSWLPSSSRAPSGSGIGPAEKLTQQVTGPRVNPSTPSGTAGKSMPAVAKAGSDRRIPSAVR